MKKYLLVLFLAINIAGYSQCVDCNSTTTSGSYSSAIGSYTIAGGSNSFAGGYHSSALGHRSISLGTYCESGDIEAISIGSYAMSNADGSFSIGRLVQTEASQAMVIGMGVSQNYMLVNPMVNSLAIGFNSTKPTLFVSQAPSNVGYTLTGKVSIGNISNAFGYYLPQAKLHIKSDEGEVADILLEPFSWKEGSQAHIHLGTSEYGISSDYRGGLVFRTRGAYIFNDGNVGINTGKISLPETRLDVVGTVKMTGFRLNTEGAQSGNVLVCADKSGEGRWVNPTDFSIWSLNEENEAYRLSNVGIGIENPREKLEVGGNIVVDDAIIGRITTNEFNDPEFLTLKGSEEETAGKIMLSKGVNNSALKIINKAADAQIQFKAGEYFMFSIRTDGIVVGNPNVAEYNMEVNGKIWAHEVEVKIQDWWDEVFHDSYNLMPIEELEQYVKINKRLPDIPSEEKVKEEGIELGEMNALLLKKVEELTLYVIELKKELDEVKQ